MKRNKQREYNRKYYKLHAKEIQAKRMAKLRANIIEQLYKERRLMPTF